MITIIDYGIGNLGSLGNIFTKLGVPYTISGKPDDVIKATVLLLPGVGSAGEGMRNLKNQKLDTVLKEKIINNTPFLGICLGMQLLFETSREMNTTCLGVLSGTVEKFIRAPKIPQIGWNEVIYPVQTIRSALWKNIPEKSEFYFVNSYYCKPSDPSIIAGQTEYGETFASVIATNFIVATQFHPEKSGTVGIQFIKNYLEAII